MKKAPSMSDAEEKAEAGGIAHTTGSAEDARTDQSAGALIRKARESAGLHIAALAVSLKVPVKKLEALEAGRFDLLPDAVFVRALASSVCRSLKIDAAPVLERLPQTSAPKLIYQGTGINTPFRGPSDGPGPSVWTQVSRPAVLAGMALLLGALVLIMLPVIKKTVSEARPDISLSAAAGPENTRSLDAVAPSEAPQTISNATGPDSPDALTAPAAAALPPAVSTVPPPVFPSSAPSQLAAPAMPAPSAAVPAQSAAAGIVVFSAKSESWVEVTDAKGTVVLRRILNAGETVGASGSLPMSAIVGRADATQVQIRGKAVDLIPLARDNVARFEVK